MAGEGRLSQARLGRLTLSVSEEQLEEGNVVGAMLCEFEWHLIVKLSFMNSRLFRQKNYNLKFHSLCFLTKFNTKKFLIKKIIFSGPCSVSWRKWKTQEITFLLSRTTLIFSCACACALENEINNVENT